MVQALQKTLTYNSKAAKDSTFTNFPWGWTGTFITSILLIPWLLYNYFHHCCALLLLANKTWFYSSAMLRLVLQDAHNTLDFTSLWLMSTTEKCNTKPNGYSNPPCGTSRLCNTELCCWDQPGMHSHVELGAWSQKQESHDRENKATHKAYELWHKSHRWASPPSKGRFMPTISCLVYPLHHGHTWQTKSMEFKSSFFSFSQTDELLSALSCFPP